MPFSNARSQTWSLRIDSARGRLLSAVRVLNRIVENPQTPVEQVLPARATLVEVCSELEELSDDVGTGGTRRRGPRSPDKELVELPFTD